MTPRNRKVIVAGYGPVGRVVADQLEQAGVEVVIIEMNPRTAKIQANMGKTVVLGSVTEEKTLHDAGIEHAEALILAIPNEDVALHACEVARRLSPHIFIAARTNFLSKGLLASKAGADYVAIEEVITAEAMRAAVMERFPCAPTNNQ